MRRDRYPLGRLLLGAVLMTGACGEPELPEKGLTGGWTTAGCAFARVPETVTMGRRTLPATPVALAEAMDRIDAGGRAEHADSYAGVEVDQELVRAVVFRVPSAAFDDFVRRTADNTCVLVRDAAHSLAHLTAWHDRVVADLATWQGRGIRISSVVARHDGVGVEIGTPEVARARRALSHGYGRTAPLVFVEQGQVIPLADHPAPPEIPTVPQPGG